MTFIAVVGISPKVRFENFVLNATTNAFNFVL